MSFWQWLLNIFTLGLYAVLEPEMRMRRDAHALARARRADEWWDKDAKALYVKNHHYGCKVPTWRKPTMAELSLCNCSKYERGIEAQYAYVQNIKLEQVTDGYSPRRMRRFSKYYKESLSQLISRERILDSLEEFTKGIEAAEKRRTDALAEVRD